jgi:hypothetical protein
MPGIWLIADAAMMVKDNETLTKIIWCDHDACKNEELQQKFKDNIHQVCSKKCRRSCGTGNIERLLNFLKRTLKTALNKNERKQLYRGYSKPPFREDWGIFYFIGIGGIGMSALARYFYSLGKTCEWLRQRHQRH